VVVFSTIRHHRSQASIKYFKYNGAKWSTLFFLRDALHVILFVCNIVNCVKIDELYRRTFPPDVPTELSWMEC